MTLSQRPTIAIMRPIRYEKDSIRICREAGFNVISVPMIEILDKKDNNFEAFVQRVQSGTSDIVIFTSANGIDHTLDKVPHRESFISALNRCRTIAIGPMTGEAAAARGINIAFIPGSYSSEGLVEAIKHDVKGKVVDIARSSHGAAVLVDGLKAAGASVFETQVYVITRPQRSKEQEGLINALVERKVDAIVFTSSMMVRNLLDLSAELGKKNEVTEALNDPGMMVAAIGHPTAKTLDINKIHVNIISKQYIFEALISEVRRKFETG